MVALKYVGRAVDADGSVVNKVWADTTNATLAVTTDWVNAAVAAEAATDTLEPPSYVDTRDGLRAHKTDVDTADALYVPVSALGQPNGVASLDSSGVLLSAQVPTGVVTDRRGLYYDAATDGTIILGSGATHQVTTTQIREYKLASIPIADPGYPWRPLVSALVGGYSGGGTTDLGLLAVMPPQGISDTIYGAALCSGVPSMVFHPVLPYGASNQTPSTVDPVHGALELDLWGSNYNGNNYNFTGTGLNFGVWVLPAL